MFGSYRRNRNRSSIASRQKSATQRRTACERAIENLESRLLFAAHIVGSSTVYSTIQAAADAASGGAVINVDAGTYPESVVITKSMTIRGAEAGVDARLNTRLSGASTIESIITGALSGTTHTYGFFVNANDVTIDGFTIQGETSQSLARGAGLVIAPNRAGARIVNNIMQNNVSGMFLANNSATDPAIIQYNVFRNNNNNGTNGGRGIYTDDTISGGNLTNVTIDSNAFYRNKGGSGTTGLESAIAMEASGAGEQSNIRITNNVLDYNGKAVLFFHTTNILIQGNQVTNTQDWYSGSLRFEGDNSNVTIQYNNVYDNTGPGVAVDSKGVPGDSSGFVVNYNNFYNNSTTAGKHVSVVVNGTQYTGVFDARYNYWGSASGPSGDGPGTGDAVYGVGHVVSGSSWSVTKGGSELYSPFATTPSVAQEGPYWGAAATAGMPIQIEDYDHGGTGVAYSDSTSGNAGGSDRPNESVDVENTTDTGGGYDVGWTVAGEWINQTISLIQGGTYNILFRVATSQTTGGKFHLNIDGVNATGSVTAPATGGNQTWQTVTVSNIAATAGTHVLRLAMDTNGSGGSIANFNWMEFLPVNTTAAPAAPINLTATTATATTVNLSWQESTAGVTGFVIQRSTDGITYTQVGATAGTVTSAVDSTAASGTSYFYRVYATNSGGNSPYSNSASVTTPALATPPSNLTAAAISSTQVNLSWTDTSPAVETGFLIERSPDGVTYAQIGSVAKSVTTYSDTGLSAATTYYYRVCATSAGGNSGYSGVASATTPVPGVVTTFLSSLSWVSATTGWNSVQKDKSINGNTITLHSTTYSRGIGTHAVSQIVYNLTGGNFTNFISDVGIDAEVKGTGSVDFQVVGDGVVLFDSGILTNASPIVSFNVNVTGVKTLTLNATNGVPGSIDYDHADWAGARLLSAPVAPTAPTGLTAAGTSSSQINLAWTNTAPSATGILIERSTDGINYTQIASVASGVSTYNDTGLSASTSYTYRVRATGAAGMSPYSATATGTTLSATVTTTYLSNLAWTSATNGWNAVQLDSSNGGNPITLRGVQYTKGIGAHAVSQIVYNINKQYSMFLSDVGVDDEENTKGIGSVDFQVLGDGVLLFDSGVLTNNSAIVSLAVNVANVTTLTLIATNGVVGTIDFDHADWAGARLISPAAGGAADPGGATSTLETTPITTQVLGSGSPNPLA